MVLREVGERADGEAGAGDPAERERVAGHLHRHVRDALLQHHREQRLQVGSLGGGERAGQRRAGDPDADGADQPGGASGRGQPGLEQVRDGGLAAGPGDAEHPQALASGRRRRSRRPSRAPRGAAGAPARAAPRRAARSRPAGSVRTATAPAARACSAKSAPWARAPGRAAKRSPGRTSAARSVTPADRDRRRRPGRRARRRRRPRGRAGRRVAKPEAGAAGQPRRRRRCGRAARRKATGAHDRARPPPHLTRGRARMQKSRAQTRDSRARTQDSRARRRTRGCSARQPGDRRATHARVLRFGTASSGVRYVSSASGTGQRGGVPAAGFAGRRRGGRVGGGRGTSRSRGAGRGRDGRTRRGRVRHQGLDRRRLRAHRQLLALGQVRADVVEQRRRARPALRGVQHDRDDVARVLGGEHARERDPVRRRGVAAARRVDLLRGAGLARHLVAGDRRGGAGAAGVLRVAVLGHRGEHRPQRPRGLRGDDPHRLGRGRRGADAVRPDRGLDDPRRDAHPVVGDRLVHPGHLQRRHRQALPDGQVAEGRARPGLAGRHPPGALAGQPDAGALAQAEAGRACPRSGPRRPPAPP